MSLPQFDLKVKGISGDVIKYPAPLYMQESGNIIVAALVYDVAPEVDKFRLDSVYSLLRSVLINSTLFYDGKNSTLCFWH